MYPTDRLYMFTQLSAQQSNHTHKRLAAALVVEILNNVDFYKEIGRFFRDTRSEKL